MELFDAFSDPAVQSILRKLTSFEVSENKDLDDPDDASYLGQVSKSDYVTKRLKFFESTGS